MKPGPVPHDSLLSLSADLLSARMLVWLASVGREAELTVDAHLYFFDRYSRLARYYRAHNHPRKAGRFQSRAEEHRRALGGGPAPPHAGAMAMPRPRRFVLSDAVAPTRLDPPDDAA